MNTLFIILKGKSNMGMNAYIFKAKTKKAFKEPNWYEK